MRTIDFRAREPLKGFPWTASELLGWRPVKQSARITTVITIVIIIIVFICIVIISITIIISTSSSNNNDIDISSALPYRPKKVPTRIYELVCRFPAVS